MQVKTLFFILSLLIFSSCSNETEKVFQLPEQVRLSSFGFFDPFYAEQFIDPPLKSSEMWNDSLLSLCGIYKMEFIQRGIKSPENEHEKYVYNFDRLGQITTFKYYNFEFSESEYSLLEFTHQHKKLIAVNVPLFYGRKNNQKIYVQPSDEKIVYLRSKPNQNTDSTTVFYSEKKPFLIVEKLGDFTSKIHFILDIKKPISHLKALLPLNGITQEQFLLAEKVLTFTEDDLPQKSYMLDENFVKSEMIAEWIYERNKKLVGFKRYINNHCVKDFTFDFSDDKLLRSFTFNRKKYEVNYN